MRLNLVIILSLAFLLCAGTRKPPVIFRLHDQTDADESGKFAIPAVSVSRPNEKIYISKLPVLTEGDIEALYVYTNPDGRQGVAFKLGRRGRNALSVTSAQRVGRLFFVFMNGRSIAELLVDRHVDDGILNVPRGFTNEEITLLTRKFPSIGPDGMIIDPKKKRKR